MELLLVLFFSAAVATGQDVLAPTYNINLDLPPKERWAQVAHSYADLYPLLKEELEKFVPKDAIDAVTFIAADLDKYFPSPYADEIRGLAKYGNITVGEVTLANIFYDVSAFSRKHKSKACTSIVTENSDGTIFHGRNLDYSLLSDTLRNLTITVHFQRGGRTVYSGTTYAGYIGLLTGQKPNCFTISLDERDQGMWWQNVIEALRSGSKGITSFHIRDTLAATEANFDWAVQYLSTVPLIAPSYIIIGGSQPMEGAVITRDREYALDVWRIDPLNGRWYVVETNYDHWKPPPSDDDRRDPAMKAMNMTGRRNINAETLFQVLSTPPVLNPRTTYTTIMSAANPGLYYSVIRHPITE